MLAIVDTLAEYGIYIAIGIGILGAVVWLATSLIGAKSRMGSPDAGGWKPPGKHH